MDDETTCSRVKRSIMDTVRIVPYGTLDISLETDNQDYLKGVHNFFEYYVKNYRWMKAYQSHGWNGKRSVFKKSTRSLPYGLLTDVVKYTMLKWKNEISVEIDNDVKVMYKGINHNINWNLLYTPHYYQEEIITAALLNAKGIFKAPTASGKSLIASYIVRELLERGETNQAIIIVPTIGLVGQFKGDMIDYYIDESSIGMVDKDHKEWKKSIVVSTWQSLKNNTRELRRYNAVLVDEVHGVRGDVLHDILQQSNAFWRLGFTGTMPQDPLEALQVKSYLGPLLKSYKSSKLADEGYIATCNVVKINVSYNREFKGDYSDVKNEVFSSPFRLNIISSIVRGVNGSILLLVDKIEKEGDILEQHIKENFPDKQVVFLHGSVDSETRMFWQKKCHDEKNVVLIATFGIFQLGINIKSLMYGVLCSSFKSSIRVLQSIGRTLRKHPTKEGGGAYIFDINDMVKFLDKHGHEREKFYGIEEFNVIDVNISEGDNCVNIRQLVELP